LELNETNQFLVYVYDNSATWYEKINMQALFHVDKA
jgi:hypothetical protein